MNYGFINPFADYGKIVYGDGFIGRKEDLGFIKNRIKHPNEAENLAIIGEPRMGKSSLVHNAIMESKDKLTANNLLPIWMNLATFDQIPDFFSTMVSYCVDEMVDLNWINKPIQGAAQLVLDNNQSWNEKYIRIQRFFKKVRQAGYRVIIILDEFDSARDLFKDNISGFQKLRELAYQPEWRVTFITMSRRTIHEIELQSNAISTFDLIFQKRYLTTFNDEDVLEYFDKMSSIGISLSDSDKGRIKFYCGGHPYLLEMLGYEIVEMFREKRMVDADKAANYIEQSFVDYYDHLIDLLQEDGSLNKLLQVLFGPVVDVKQTDIDKLLRYGRIRLGSNGAYTGFSEHFHTFLNLVQREVDLWPIWSETEKKIRNLITTTMLKQYGVNWIPKLEKANPKLKKIFDRCRDAQNNEKRSFGSRSSYNLIDFTYPRDLFTIIFAEWNTVFRPIFGKDKPYWDERIKLLAKVRNPLAHNRDDSLHKYERQIAEGYCKEILSIL